MPKIGDSGEMELSEEHQSLNRQGKVWFLIFSGIMLISFSFLVYQLMDIQVFHHEEFNNKAKERHVKTIVMDPRRGNILDARGNLLATSLFVKTVCADPSMIGPYGSDLAKALSSSLEIEEGLLRTKLKPKLYRDSNGTLCTNKFVVLKRKVTRKKWQEITESINQIDFGIDESNLTRGQKQLISRAKRSIHTLSKKDQLRLYPGRRLASHVLGFVGGVDHTGKEGIESVLDSKLTGTQGWRITEADSRRREVVSFRQQDVAARNGLNVRLTIDSGIQHIVESELDKAMAKHRPKGMTVIIVVPSTGEIVAMANRPDFDPNNPGSYPAGHRRNRAVTDIAEPGSTFKAVTVAAALNERQVSLGTVFNCEGGAFYYGGRRLRDDHSYSRLNVKEIIKKSSNIGSAKIALGLGSAKLHQYISEFGFGERTRINLPGEVRGTLHPLARWNKLSITRVPMGHEVTATPIQMVMMFSAVANKGKLMRPKLLRQLEDEQGKVVVRYHSESVRQVVSSETALKVTEALKTVVQPGGTAVRAGMGYFSVAGKTGTAQKAIRGRYVPGKYYSSFVGFFPADRPVLCIYVALDEPTGDYYASQTAAPIFRSIAERSASYLGVRPDLVVPNSVVSRSGGR